MVTNLNTKRSAALVRGITDPALKDKKLKDYRKAVWQGQQQKDATGKPIKLIKEAQTKNVELITQVNNTLENLTILAEDYDTTPVAILENVLQVLANFTADVQAGKPVHALANIGSLAAFLAGTEAVAGAVGQLDPQKQQRTLQALRDVAIGNDGMVSVGAQPLVDTGVNKPQLQQKYAGLIQTYLGSIKAGKPDNQALLQALGKLRMTTDAAMRTAAPQPGAAAKPVVQPGAGARPGVAPATANTAPGVQPAR